MTARPTSRKAKQEFLHLGIKLAAQLYQGASTQSSHNQARTAKMGGGRTTGVFWILQHKDLLTLQPCNRGRMLDSCFVHQKANAFTPEAAAPRTMKKKRNLHWPVKEPALPKRCLEKGTSSRTIPRS